MSNVTILAPVNAVILTQLISAALRTTEMGFGMYRETERQPTQFLS